MSDFIARGRPSASMVVAVVALFVALGGVGLAAFRLPARSVGTKQLKDRSVTRAKLRNGSVSNSKLARGSVAGAQIDAAQVQARVNGTCADSAINAINSAGGVTCGAAPPPEFGAGSASVPIGTTSTPVVGKLLPGGLMLVIANQYLAVPGSPTSQIAPVTCTLSVSGTTFAATRTVSLAAATAFQQVAMPIVATVAVPAAGGTATVACSQTPSPALPVPAIKVQGTINAIRVASTG